MQPNRIEKSRDVSETKPSKIITLSDQVKMLETFIEIKNKKYKKLNF